MPDVKQKGRKQKSDPVSFQHRGASVRSDISISYAQPSQSLQSMSARKFILRRRLSRADLKTYNVLSSKYRITYDEPSEAIIWFTGCVHDDSLNVSDYDPGIALSMLESRQDTNTAICSQSSRVPSFPSDVIPQPVYASRYGEQNVDLDMTRESMIRQMPRITIQSGMKLIVE